jgi:hypothetical protein
MNLINEHDPARQAALNLSRRLGSLAADSSAARPRPASTPLGTPPRAPLPPRLSAALGHFRHKARVRQDAADKLRVNEFMTGT